MKSRAIGFNKLGPVVQPSVYLNLLGRAGMVVASSSPHPTKRAMESGDFAAKSGLYYIQEVSSFDGESKSRPLPQTQTVKPLFLRNIPRFILPSQRRSDVYRTDCRADMEEPIRWSV